MFYQNLVKFGIEIRRQKKLSLFKDLRREFQQIQQIKKDLQELLHIPVIKQNYSIIKNVLEQINENMLTICSKMQKAQEFTNQEGEIKMLHTSGSPQIHRLFTSNKFRNHLLDVFEKLNQPCVKVGMNSNQQRNKLVQEVVILLGVILKEPYFLKSYFPLLIFIEMNQNKHELQLFNEKEQHFGVNYQQETYQSFQLLQQIIFFIRQNFTTINQILSNTKTFLTLLHCIKRVMQHFTQNSIINHINSKNMAYVQKDDSQSLHFLYQLLKSNNLQHYIKELIQDIIDTQNENNKSNNSNNNFNFNNKFNLLTINLAISEVSAVFMDFVHKVNPNIELSKMFISKLLKFTQKSMKQVHCFNTEISILGLQQVNLNNQIENETNQYKYLRLLSFWMLFSTHGTVCHQKIQPSNHLLRSVCNEIIVFLHNIKVNQRMKYVDGSKMKYQDKNNAKKEFMERLNPVQYYFKNLVCQYQSDWFSELQLLGCLFDMVSKHKIGLQELFALSLEIKQNESSLFQIKIDTKLILSFFETVGESILTLSGSFYNQRHRFMSTIVYLFIEWYESVEDYENKMRKQEDFKQEFTVEFMRHLGQIVINNLRQLKSSINTIKQLLQVSIPINHNDSLNKQSSLNISIFQVLTQLQQSLLNLFQKGKQPVIDIEI